MEIIKYSSNNHDNECAICKRKSFGYASIGGLHFEICQKHYDIYKFSTKNEIIAAIKFSDKNKKEAGK